MGKGITLNQGFGGPTTYSETDPATQWEIPGTKILTGAADQNGGPVTRDNPFYVFDVNGAPYEAPVQVTVGETFPACRAIGFIATTPGFATVTFPNTTVMALAATPGGLCEYPLGGCTLTAMDTGILAYALN